MRQVALVVDDLLAVRAYIAMLLGLAGFDTVEASSGHEAWKLVTEAKGGLDIIVSDVRMPDGDGCALARSVQAKYPDLPVLLISGSHDSLADSGIQVEVLESPSSRMPYCEPFESSAPLREIISERTGQCFG